MADQSYDPERGELNWLKAVAHPRDSELASLCQQFVKKPSQERTAMRVAMNTKDASALLGFASRAALHAIREQSSDWAINGLTAVAMIEAAQFDFREILIALGLLHHAATRTGLDADQLFRDWALLAEPGTAELITDFPKRPPDKKALSAWVYEEAETDAGIVLIRGGFGRSKPTFDLIAIAIEMAEHFVADKYRYPTCEFGKMMPTIWLHSEDDAALNQALKAFRTGASISAELRPTTGVKEFSQHFVAFLLEMKSEVAAQQLMDIARKSAPSFFYKVELLAGRLFCLIVARSLEERIEPYESQESLARFSKPIGDILQRHVTSTTSKR